MCKVFSVINKDFYQYFTHIKVRASTQIITQSFLVTENSLHIKIVKIPDQQI